MMHAFVVSGVGFFTGYTVNVSIKRIVTEPKSLADAAITLNERLSASTNFFIQPQVRQDRQLVVSCHSGSYQG